MEDLQAAALDLVRDDYESAATIQANVAERIGREVSEREVRDALLSLSVAGLVSVFVFDRSTQRFAKAADKDIASNIELWFHVVGGKV